MQIEESAGYKKLLAAVEVDEQKAPGFHDYRAKLAWTLARARHYSEKTGIEAAAILDAWENERNYWYQNFYQECNFPEIKGNNVRVFESQEQLRDSISDAGFRCPACGGVSTSPYECNSGLYLREGKICNWKSYGLFGTLGKGVYVFVKSAIRGQNLFMPVAWETEKSHRAPMIESCNVLTSGRSSRTGTG
jgi:hypothetical protein